MAGTYAHNLGAKPTFVIAKSLMLEIGLSMNKGENSKRLYSIRTPLLNLSLAVDAWVLKLPIQNLHLAHHLETHHT